MKKSIIKSLESLPFFSKSALKVQENLNSKALQENLQRWVKSGDIFRLKNGLYVTKTFVDRSSRDKSYIELIANKLLAPSYLSLEYVLQKNNFLTEATFAITSITLKTTRHYKNQLGFYDYRHMNQKHYFGFEQKFYGRNVVYEASLAKAIFDFLYLRLHLLDPNDISTLESLRLNWSQMAKKSFNELRTIILNCGIKKLLRMIPVLEEIYHGNSDQ